MQCQAAIYARMEHKSLLRHHTQMVSTWTCNLSTPVERKKYVNYLFFYLNKAVIRNGVVKFCGKYKSSFVALLYNDNILQSFFLFQDDFAKYTASKYSIYIRIWVYYYEKWLCYITTFFWQTLFEDLDYPTLWSTAINKVS